jgi:hypothetical protein
MTSRDLEKLATKMRDGKIAPISMYALIQKGGSLLFDATRLSPFDRPILVARVLTGRERSAALKGIKPVPLPPTFYVTKEDYPRFVADEHFAGAGIHVSDGTVRPDLYDGRLGGELLTTRGTIRKRRRNFSSTVIVASQ